MAGFYINWWWSVKTWQHLEWMFKSVHFCVSSESQQVNMLQATTKQHPFHFFSNGLTFTYMFCKVCVSEKPIEMFVYFFCQVLPWVLIHVFIWIHLVEMILTVEGPKMATEPVPKSKIQIGWWLHHSRCDVFDVCVLSSYRSMHCGKIFCVGGNEYPFTGQKAIISTLRGLCHIAGDGSEGNNLSMVPTGTKCGPNKVWRMLQQVFIVWQRQKYDVSLLRFNRFAMISRARTWMFTAVMKAVRSNAVEEG